MKQKKTGQNTITVSLRIDAWVHYTIPMILWALKFSKLKVFKIVVSKLMNHSTGKWISLLYIMLF